jgi:hypothetical protein
MIITVLSLTEQSMRSYNPHHPKRLGICRKRKNYSLPLQNLRLRFPERINGMYLPTATTAPEFTSLGPIKRPAFPPLSRDNLTTSTAK